MRALNRLSALAVKTLSAPGRHADGGNLFLSIGNGGRSWIFLYRDRASMRLREMGLGPVNSVSLQEARQKAAAARKLLHDGVDPITEKKAKREAAKKDKTFGEFADTFVESIMPGFKNDKHQAQWKSTLATYAAPLRPMLLKDIATTDVHRVLAPIWNVKHETAARLRGRIERIFEAAKASGLRTGDNPARWRDNLKPLLSKHQVSTQHHKAIPFGDMPAFMVELRGLNSMSALALEFTILTAARTGETIGATWSEIDLDAKLWKIPAERMKAQREHQVPLSDRAVEILRTLKPGKPTDFVFHGARRSARLSNMTMLECLRGLRDGATVHGFRSTLKDWAAETTVHDNIVTEMALAHAVGDKVEAAYRRGDLFQKRRALMNDWLRFLAGDAGNVISITRRTTS